VRKLLSLIVVFVAVLALTACGGKEKSSTLKVNFAVGNNQRTFTYNHSDPLEFPDGTTVTAGELKPMWQYIEQQLDIDLEDVTTQDQKSSDMIQLAAATGFKNANIYGGNSIAEKFMQYGPEEYFVNLADNLDKLPNFAKYLEDYPSVKSAITAWDGGIYHIPYVAEIDNFARVYHARTGWIELLLDGTTGHETETATLEVAYDGFWKGDNERNATNVIELQNAAASGDTLTQAQALSTLIEYIEDTYDYEKPSQLYVGEDAQYDIDELVALWRVIKLSPKTLSKEATGVANADAIIVPYTPRQTSYREDILRFANYFAGQRVFGSDSYGSKFYLDSDGELQYSYAETNFLNLVDYFKDFYSEGLVNEEFSNTSDKTNYRTTFFGKDNVANHNQFGFMTFDFIASTTAISEDVKGILPPVTTVDGGTDFVHYVENNRSIKPDGWAISAVTKGKTLDDAFKLFDYMFSEEGNNTQNFGIPANIDETGKFKGPSGTEYTKLNDWFLTQADKFANGDASTFVRDFIGANMPIGYQKSIGFEYQYTVNDGFNTWELYNNNDVLTSTYKQVDSPYFSLVPPVFALTDQDTAVLNTLGITEAQVDAIFLYITGADTAVENTAALRQLYVDAKVEEYIEVYREAYARMSGE
jgi:hypothetical protein